MAGLRSVILFVILGATLVAATSDPRSRRRSICPQTAIHANLTNPKTFQSYQRVLVHRIWNSNFVPEFSSNALRLVKMMKAMSNGKNRYRRSVAYLHASWASILLQRTNFERQPCIFVEMINSAVTFEKLNDANPAVITLRRFADGIQNMCLRAGDGTLALAGCKGLRYVPTLEVECNWQNYDIDSAWDLFGDRMPSRVRSLVKSLYRSRNLVDKLMAIMMTVSITPLMRDIYFAHVQQYLIESVSFVTTNLLPPQCCAYRRQRILDLCKYHETDCWEDVKCLTKNKYIFVAKKPSPVPCPDGDYISN